MPLRWRPEAREIVEQLEASGVAALGGLAQRAGHVYTATDLAFLARATSPVPALPPPLGGGVEALVELDVREAGVRLRGWPVLGGALTATGGILDRIATVDPLRIEPYGVLDDRLIAAARAHAPSRPLRLFLAWLNSD